MKSYTQARGLRALARGILVALAVAAPTFGLALSVQPGSPHPISLAAPRAAQADCEGPPPRPDLDNCGNPLPTPTPTPGGH